MCTTCSGAGRRRNPPEPKLDTWFIPAQGGCVLRLPVDLSSVTNLDNDDLNKLVYDVGHQPIVANSILPVASQKRPLEFFTYTPWIIQPSQPLVHELGDPLLDHPIQPIEVPGSVRIQPDFKTHRSNPRSMRNSSSGMVSTLPASMSAIRLSARYKSSISSSWFSIACLA